MACAPLNESGAHTHHAEEDTCMSYEEEDTCKSYEEEDTQAQE
jgi:hypothetical protein